MRNSIAVIGVGNMAKAIINGILRSSAADDIVRIHLYDLNKDQYSSLLSEKIIGCDSINSALADCDTVLLSVKPQNYPEVLDAVKNVCGYKDKLYISIGAGISTDNVRNTLGDISVVRALPNLPMVIGKGVTAICENDLVDPADINFVKNVFLSSGSVLMIKESEMNKTIGVTSSSPAYVFKFIAAICAGARSQGIDSDELIKTVCDMVIGSAEMLKNSEFSPEELIARVASKGGTTERALLTLDLHDFDETIIEAMKACTERADELGNSK